MTPDEFRFWNNANRRAAGLSAEIRAAILRALQAIRDNMSDGELSDIVESGNFDRLFTDVLSDQMMDRGLLSVRQRIRGAVERGFRYAVPNLPGAGQIDGAIAIAFDYLNPKIITAVRGLDSKVMTTLKTDIRETVRAFVENGLRDGVNPRVIGRQIRDMIGLSPNQLQQVDNYRDALNGVNGRSVTDYTLRDLRLKPTTPEQIDRAVAIYRKRRIAQNAEVNARTAALDAMKLGQRLSWQDAIDKGIVDGDRLKHQWIGVLDDRERPSHVAMEKEIQPFALPYSNGELVPGESTYNCRCIDKFFIARA